MRVKGGLGEPGHYLGVVARDHQVLIEKGFVAGVQ